MVINMKLESFGSILSFAVGIEEADYLFYKTLTESDICTESRDIFLHLAANAKKNGKKMLKVRQENVSEMILEPIHGFDSDSFVFNRDDIDQMNEKEALQRALEIETTAESYYSQAAEKMKTLSEVSRILKKTAKRRTMNITKLTVYCQ